MKALLGAFLIILLALVAAANPAEAKRKKVVKRYAPPAAAMAVDLHSGQILHSHNMSDPRYPASLTKVMTLYLLFDDLRDGKVTMNKALTVSANAAAKPPSKIGLKPGQTITVENAIKALVTKSANDVAVTIAEALAGSEDEFARRMTQKARTIGMTGTIFKNASGLPNAYQRTTAKDMILMARAILADHPKHARIFNTRYFKYEGKTYKNHNSLLFSYDGMEGMKTGFTNASGFNLIAHARRNNKHVLAVVLGGPSARSRNAAMRKLLNTCWNKAATEQAARKMTLAAYALAAPFKVKPNFEDAAPALATAQAPVYAYNPPQPERKNTPALAAAMQSKLASASASAKTADVNAQPAVSPGSSSTQDAQGPQKAAPRYALAGVAVKGAPLVQIQGDEDTVSPDAPETAGTGNAEKSADAAKADETDQQNEEDDEKGPETPYEQAFPEQVANVSVHVKTPGPKTELALLASATAIAHPDAANAGQTAAIAPILTAAQESPQKLPAIAAVPAQDQAQASQEGPYHIQVGSYADIQSAEARHESVKKAAGKLIEGYPFFTMQVDLPRGTVIRARYGQLKEAQARKVCASLKRRAIDCMVVRVD